MSRSPSLTPSDAELLEDLPDSFDYAAHREKRLQELAEEMARVRELQAEGNVGRVVTLTEEQELVQRIAKSRYCLVHFFHPSFPKCKTMDSRLAQLAPRYRNTIFLRASVADTPFFVGKFGIQVLPCVLAFMDGQLRDRLIGFEELGNSDSFSLSTLEFRLKHTGVLITTEEIRQRIVGDETKDGSDSDDERQRRETRRGKTGIRNGMASTGLGYDD
ncbi:hypothetical protein TREMEDRAFT_67971 [Tremella mesenterica DSM 1558]|uniref:uncharacterized protein n=1 Tax=Tremella mesenterica (strain ATCC 24925 / CBS 8224 / DSM 1558 / NBRC 9311 / NRRL Y-6157 / RJB 2259-6 / UBC 559-6) TaxID=578456 RepID=UPI0003F491F3|nr:uncharacterized protein TREMEDRAFT_67971 [Tremella mesenterica DSM 1558]EIW71815.1 hypothetical protein TREMEDRAFT_67971 [Tremella mesenterica DSM 1558]